MSINNKLIFITIDGLRYDTALANMGYLHHLVENQIAARWRVQSELPSISRVLYEVLLTGTPAYLNGIHSNDIVRLSNQESIFHLARKAGLTTSAASYYWISELYNHAPFDKWKDRLQFNEDAIIQNGIFYYSDDYPDTHLFADANYLVTHKKSDFVYIHSMNIDDYGHKFTADSKEYRNRVIIADQIISNYIPQWMELGYQIIVTADHGMNDDGMHGGTTEADRSVPLFIISNKVKGQIHTKTLPQLQLAPLACFLLGIKPSAQMQPLDDHFLLDNGR